jgi:hypothetical protein
VVAFVFRISDESMGGTCITILFSFFNFGKTFGEPSALFLMDYISWMNLNIIALGLECLFLFLTFKEFGRVENIPKEKLAPNYVEDSNGNEMHLLNNDQ